MEMSAVSISSDTNFLEAPTFAETGNGLDSDGTGGVSPETVTEAAKLSLSALWKRAENRCEFPFPDPWR